ncbi:hypothetical protein ACF0H5_001049 [Mactra antiquata]
MYETTDHRHIILCYIIMYTNVLLFSIPEMCIGLFFSDLYACTTHDIYCVYVPHYKYMYCDCIKVYCKPLPYCQFIVILLSNLSFYCQISVSLLSDFCQFVVRFLSVYCQISVSLLSDFCQLIVRFVRLSDFCQFIVRFLSVNCQISVS